MSHKLSREFKLSDRFLDAAKDLDPKNTSLATALSRHCLNVDGEIRPEGQFSVGSGYTRIVPYSPSESLYSMSVGDALKKLVPTPDGKLHYLVHENDAVSNDNVMPLPHVKTTDVALLMDTLNALSDQHTIPPKGPYFLDAVKAQGGNKNARAVTIVCNAFGNTDKCVHGNVTMLTVDEAVKRFDVDAEDGKLYYSRPGEDGRLDRRVFNPVGFGSSAKALVVETLQAIKDKTLDVDTLPKRVEPSRTTGRSV